jgi:glycosyltransferase involved in cell wall biosynthesis
MPRLLCVLTSLLGNKSTTQRIVDALNKIDDLDTKFVILTPDDYARYPAPPWAQATNPWHVQYIAKKKVQPLLQEHFDLLFVYSWEFVVAFGDVARSIPAAALMDTVPATIDRQLRRRGLGGWKRRMSHELHHRSFRRAASHFRVFFPMGSDCADALIERYGVSRDRCFITLAPQDLSVWKPAARQYAPPMRLLFVTNDFARKGGDFLLRLYSGHLSNVCNLTIASNDPALDNRALPANVELLRGCSRDELLKVYQQSDLFLFPTQQDYMPQVLAEALATGLPCMAHDIGGIRDLVQDGETGYLMQPGDPPERWADRIGSLLENPAKLRGLSVGARKFAEASLNLTAFENLLVGQVASLRRDANPPAA